MPRTTRAPIVSVLAASLLVTLGSGPAGAAVDPAEQLAAHIEAVAPDQGAVMAGEVTGGAAVTQVGDVEATVPLDPAAPITLEAATPVPLAAVAPIEVSLPEEINVATGTVTDDGTMVYESTNGDVDAAVQVLADGSVRAQTIINRPDAPHTFTYPVGEGHEAAIDAATGTAALLPTGDGAAGVVLVDAPWAVDANGAPVATHYEVGAGGELVQVIEATDTTAYPVVADPRWTWYAGAYGAKLTRTETIKARSWGVAAFMCAAGGPLAGICSFMVGYVVAQANLSGPGTCLFITAAPPGLIFRVRC